MPTHLVNAAFAIVAVCAAGGAIYFWRRASSLYALLVEGANRFEELRQRNAQLEQNAQKTEERLRLQREGALKAEAAAEEARVHAAELGRKLEQKDAEGRAACEKLELQ